LCSCIASLGVVLTVLGDYRSFLLIFLSQFTSTIYIFQSLLLIIIFMVKYIIMLNPIVYQSLTWDVCIEFNLNTLVHTKTSFLTQN
jgi:hypothetical protein